MGMADIAEVLWRDYLSFLNNPSWVDRDLCAVQRSWLDAHLLVLHLTVATLALTTLSNSVSYIRKPLASRVWLYAGYRDNDRAFGSRHRKCCRHGVSGKNSGGTV